MPVNKKKMAAMKKTYGAKKGKDVYYASEMKGKKKKTKKKSTMDLLTDFHKLSKSRIKKAKKKKTKAKKRK